MINKTDAKIVILLRGVSSSGKTTLANHIADGKYPVIAADDYFYDKEGNYNWDPSKLHIAHQTCQKRVEDHMKDGTRMILVTNTMTRTKDLKPYIDMAKENGYTLFSIIVEKRHENSNAHNVSEETLSKMVEQLMNNIKLI